MGLMGAIDRQALLSCFFAGCESYFAFLERKHGFDRLSGLASYERGRTVIRPYEGGHVPPCFTAMCRFERGDTAIELTFEEQDFRLSAHALYNRIDRLALADLAGADFGGSSGLFYGEQVASSLSHLAAAFNRQADMLTAPGPDLVDSALKTRAARLHGEIDSRFRENMEYACRQATLAFLENDDRRVVELLTPFARHLPGGVLKKLEIARRRLLS